MKKIFLAILLLIPTVITVDARQPQRGYRGFVDWSNDFNRKSYYDWTYEPTEDGWAIAISDKTHKENTYYSGISTSHGYQFNSWLYTGLGLDIEHCRKWNETRVTPFLDMRTDQQFGKFTPFADLRIGYVLNDGDDFYLSPTLGYRFNWGRKMGINVGLGYSLVCFKGFIYEFVENPSGYQTMEKTSDFRSSNSYFTFRVGIDF